MLKSQVVPVQEVKCDPLPDMRVRFLRVIANGPSQVTVCASLTIPSYRTRPRSLIVKLYT